MLSPRITVYDPQEKRKISILPIPFHLFLHIILFLLTFTVFVAECGLPHVTEPYGALAAAVGEGVTLLWVKLR